MWAHYRRKRGSLNPGVMTELGIAGFSAFYATTKFGKKYTMWDFTPHFDQPEAIEPKEISFEDFVKAF